MKKYIAPELQMIEMETAQIVATSNVSVYSGSEDETTTIQLEGRRRRGNSWGDYER